MALETDHWITFYMMYRYYDILPVLFKEIDNKWGPRNILTSHLIYLKALLIGMSKNTLDTWMLIYSLPDLYFKLFMSAHEQKSAR